MQTIIIKWYEDGGYNRLALLRAAETLRKGGLVAFPTETVYGLGGNGLLEEASGKIYAAKGRPSDNPLILHISDIEMLYDIAENVPKAAKKLAKAFWPGPLTMVFKKKRIVPDTTTGGLDTVAVRMPVHGGALELIREAGVPVAAPSANISGRPSPTKASHVIEDMMGKIDIIIDGEDVGIGYESTIVDVTSDVPTILRPGFITEKMLSEVVGKVEVDPGILGGDEKPKAPGMKYRHYAPKADMLVFEGDIEKVVGAINERLSEHMGHISESTGDSDKERKDYRAEESDKDEADIRQCIDIEHVGVLATDETKARYVGGKIISVGSRKDGTAGRDLYAALRRFDELDVKLIYAENFRDMDKSEAIMNRLLKAAGQHSVEA